MRKLCLVLSVLILPLPAIAQQGWSLPSIGLPPPPPPRIPVVQSVWRQHTPWERLQVPSWENPRLRPWDTTGARRGSDRDHYRGNTQYIYVPYAVAVQQPPQVIVVQQPPVTPIVRIEVPAAASRAEESRAAEPPTTPYVPTGDRTLYVIPGCYVGNVSPLNLKLPTTCDITKLTTYVP